MKRPTVWAVIFTICGIYCRLGMAIWACLVCFLFVGVSMLCFMIKRKERKWCFLFVFFLLGMTVAGVVDHPKPSSALVGSFIEGEGMIINRSVSASGYQKLYVKSAVLADKEYEMNIYMIVSEENSVKMGDTIAFQGELMEFEKQSIPGGFDERRYYITQGMEYKMFPDEVQIIGHENTIAAKIVGLKEKIYAGISAVLPKEEASIIMAMVTGERDYLSDEINDLYTTAGITHILSISGLHMSILCLFICFFFEKICGLGTRRAAMATFGVCALFLIFTGFSPSCARAGIMISLVLTGRVIFRREDWMTSICVAAMIILLWQPYYLWNAGFQLSFMTATGICLTREIIDDGRDWKSKGKNTLLVAIYAFLFSAPIIAYHFQYISPSGLIVNLMILPLCSMLLGLGILTVIVSLFWLEGATFIAGSVYVILQGIRFVCKGAQMVPHGYVLVGSPSLFSVCLCFALFLCVTYYGRENRICNKKTIIALSVLFLYSTLSNRFIWKKNTVAFLDVGQGDAIVITTHDNRAFLIDGGGRFNREFGENTGIQTVKPYLEYMGISHLDGVAISHMDMDHCVGALEIAEDMETEAIYISDYPFEDSQYLDKLKEIVEKKEILLYTVKQNDSALWKGNGTFASLYPNQNATWFEGDDNHGSMVLRYEYGGTSVLFAGDAGISDEKMMLDAELDLKADILKLGHHGSKYSTSETFLMEVAPEIGVISAGKNNNYGHPHIDLLERLEKAEVKQYRTDTSGSVIATLSPNGEYSVVAMKERESVYERIKEAMEK